MENQFQSLVQGQRDFFNENHTKDINYRIDLLKKILKLLQKNEKDLDKAIDLDFGKSSFETYMTELSLVYHEIKLAISNLKSWSKPKRVATNLANIPGSSHIMPEPLGVVLVIGAWNYPYQLSLLPMVSAIAAGNTVIIKPSEISSSTSAVMARLINENFQKEQLAVVEGGVEETTDLLKCEFDKIFYTGNSRVAKIIMSAASKFLTPVVLELGGKSPAFIDDRANIKIAAQRIVWGKFLNAGQTCVAPDYLLVHSNIVEEFIGELQKNIEKYYKGDLSESDGYVRIINRRNFDRLINLIDEDKVVIGGKHYADKLIIEPTVLKDVSFDEKVMEDEIFGPILPIVVYDDLDWAIKKVKSLPKPLALYVFSNDKVSDRLFSEISFGGGIKNDAVMHLSNSKLPFGGVGNSGTGNYHGKFGFDAFSHHKSIMRKSDLFEPNIKFQPYKKWKKKLIEILLG